MKMNLLRYFFLCMLIYLSLSAIEIFLLKPVIDMITSRFWWQLVIYGILLLIVNPLVTRITGDHFDLANKEDEEEDE